MNLQMFFKSLVFLAVSTFLFSCGDEEITSSSTGCPELAFSYNNVESNYYFEADFPEMETLSWYGWTVNGDVVDNEGSSVEGDGFFETDLFAAGTYQICLVTETPDCPEGAEFCETIVVEGEPNETEGCPEMALVYTETPSEHQFAVSFPNEDGPDLVFWSVNGMYVGDGFTYAADFTEAGTYEVCGGIETGECPLGAFVCHTVVIEGETQTEGCPEMEITFTQNGADFVFVANYENALDWYGWAINGEYVEDEGTNANGDDILNHSFNAPGTYSVCVLHESGTCNFYEECVEVVVE